MKIRRDVKESGRIEVCIIEDRGFLLALKDVRGRTSPLDGGIDFERRMVREKENRDLNRNPLLYRSKIRTHGPLQPFRQAHF